MTFDELLEQRFKGKGGHRQLRPFRSYGARHLIDGGGRRVLNFASNDYLGLSSLDQTIHLSSQPSSRLLAGNTQKHLDLEDQLADFIKRPASLIYPSGYSANLGVLSCVAQRGDLILMDRLSHASLLDGARLSGARIERFRHQDLSHLEDLLRRHQNDHQHLWVVSEGLFSMDGDLCPVRDLVSLKNRFGAHLILDEAHSMGIYGKNGRGWSEEQGVLDEIDILSFNLSKAFALQGGVICGSKILKDALIRNSRQQIYTTATPISHLEALPSRLQALLGADALRRQLRDLSLELAHALGRHGDWSPIVPFLLGDAEDTLKLAEKLWDLCIFCPAILPPTVPPNTCRLRISLNALHTREDLNLLSSALG